MYLFQNFISVDLLKARTLDESKMITHYSPQFLNHKGICRCQTFKIPLDCLIFVNASTNLNNLYELIVDKVNLHLQAVKQCYLTYYQVNIT